MPKTKKFINDDDSDGNFSGSEGSMNQYGSDIDISDDIISDGGLSADEDNNEEGDDGNASDIISDDATSDNDNDNDGDSDSDNGSDTDTSDNDNDNDNDNFDSEQEDIEVKETSVKKDKRKNRNAQCVYDYMGLGDEGENNIQIVNYFTDIVEPNKKTLRKPEERITKPFLFKYEKYRVLSVRTSLLADGAKSLIKGASELPPYEVAKLEFQYGVLPLKIIRDLPDNTYEIWSLNELTKF